jgi:hypothetical protein
MQSNISGKSCTVSTTQDDTVVTNGLFKTLMACNTLAVDRREVTIEAGLWLANKGHRRVSDRSVELGIASGSEPGT